MTHPFRSRFLVVLAIAAGCQVSVPPTAPPTSSALPTATGALVPTAPLPPTPTAEPAVTPVPTPTPLTTISQATTLGTVTLEIPTSLLPPGTPITITAQPLEDAPREVRDAGVRQAFHVLAPENLIFGQPVTVTVDMPRAAFTRPDGSLAIVFGALRSPYSGWDWLASASMTAGADTVEIAGTTTHLGELFIWSDLTNLAAIAPDAGPRPVGTSYRPLLALVAPPGRAHPVGAIGTPEVLVDDPTVLTIGPPLADSLSRDLTCVSVGTYTVTFVAQLANFAEDSTFFATTLKLLPTTGTLSYVVTGSCVSSLPTATPPPNNSPSSST